MRVALLLLLFQFALSHAQVTGGSQPPAADSTPKKPLMFVEKMPSFPGGETELRHFLSSNLHYPAEMRKNGLEGTVVVQFVVNPDGSISDTRVLRDIGGGSAEEVLRVINAMPKWTPGTNGGEAVPVYYNLPVSFTLAQGNVKQEKKKKKHAKEAPPPVDPKPSHRTRSA